MEADLRQIRNDQITEQLNRVYAHEPPPDEKRLVRGMKQKFAKVVKDPW